MQTVPWHRMSHSGRICPQGVCRDFVHRAGKLKCRVPKASWAQLVTAMGISEGEGLWEWDGREELGAESRVV